MPDVRAEPVEGSLKSLLLPGAMTLRVKPSSTTTTPGPSITAEVEHSTNRQSVLSALERALVQDGVFRGLLGNPYSAASQALVTAGMVGPI